MNFRECLEKVLSEYGIAKEEEFVNHPLANFLRHTIPEVIMGSLGAAKLDKRKTGDAPYLIKGSVGPDDWVEVPWVGILDKILSTTFQDGFYIVYLFRRDLSGVYLSLNQGVTRLKEAFGAKTEEALVLRAKTLTTKIATLPDGFEPGEINLAESPNSELPVLYERGNICSVFYPIGKIPEDAKLFSDLKQLMQVYKALATEELATPDSEIDPKELAGKTLTERRKVRIHYSLERRPEVARKVKKVQGHTCKVCGLDFKLLYGEAAEGFIEAHHLTPLSDLMEDEIKRDPLTDFAVLCANCHRMIHKLNFISDIQGFKGELMKIELFTHLTKLLSK